MVFSRFGSGRQSSQLQAQKATLGSGTGASEALSRPACHGVFPFRKRPPKQSAAGSESDASKASFLAGSESDGRQLQAQRLVF